MPDPNDTSVLVDPEFDLLNNILDDIKLRLNDIGSFLANTLPAQANQVPAKKARLGLLQTKLHEWADQLCTYQLHPGAQSTAVLVQKRRQLEDAMDACSARIESIIGKQAPVAVGGAPIGPTPIAPKPNVINSTFNFREEQIPKFDGQFSQYREFYTMFHNLVHTSTNMTDLEKFIILKNRLSGKAYN